MKVADYLKGGVELLQKHPFELIVAGLLALVGIVTCFLAGPALAGMVHIALKARRGEKPEILDVFKGFDHFTNTLFVAVAALSVLVVVMLISFLPAIGKVLDLAFLALAAPIAAMLILYAVPLVVDKNMGWKPALNASLARVSKGLMGHLAFGFASAAVFAIPFIGPPIYVGAVLCAYSDASAELVSLASKGTPT